MTIACLAGPLSKVQPWHVYPAAVSITNLCMGGYDPRTKKSFMQYTYAVGENSQTSRTANADLHALLQCGPFEELRGALICALAATRHAPISAATACTGGTSHCCGR